MSASPADFDLYYRATGIRPTNEQEKASIAPHAYHYARSFARKPEEPNFLQQAGDFLGKAALAGGTAAALYGLTRAGGGGGALANPFAEAVVDNLTNPPGGGGGGGTPTGSSPTAGISFNPPVDEGGSTRPDRPKPPKPPNDGGGGTGVRMVNLNADYSAPSYDTSDGIDISEPDTGGSIVPTSPDQSDIVDPWDDSNVSVLPRTQEKTAIGKWGADVVDRVKSGTGSPMWNWGAPTATAGIVMSPRPWETPGYGYMRPELGAAGEVLSNLGETAGDIIISNVPGGEAIGGAMKFGGGVLKNVPGLVSGAASLGTRAVELAGIGGATVLDRAAHDTLRSGAYARDLYNYAGGEVPTLGDIKDFHGNVLVPSGKRMAGAVMGTIQATANILPTSSTQSSGNLLEGSEPQVTRHPDLPPGESDFKVPSKNIQTPIFDEDPYVNKALTDAYMNTGIQFLPQGKGVGESTAVKTLRTQNPEGQAYVTYHKNAGDEVEYQYSEPDGKALVNPQATVTGILGKRTSPASGGNVGTVRVSKKDLPAFEAAMDDKETIVQAEEDAYAMLNQLTKDKGVSLYEDVTAGRISNLLNKGTNPETGQSLLSEFINENSEEFDWKYPRYGSDWDVSQFN